MPHYDLLARAFVEDRGNPRPAIAVTAARGSGDGITPLPDGDVATHRERASLALVDTLVDLEASGKLPTGELLGEALLDAALPHARNIVLLELAGATK